MNDVIDQYQKWKEQGQDLRVKAKLAMETRFQELLAEAAKVAEDYRADFGGVLRPAPPVTAFQYRAAKRKKAVKSGKTAPVKAPAVTKKTAPPHPANPKITSLRKRLEAARKKLETAKAAGAPTRDIDDRIYEIEDALTAALKAQSS